MHQSVTSSVDCIVLQTLYMCHILFAVARCLQVVLLFCVSVWYCSYVPFSFVDLQEICN